MKQKIVAQPIRRETDAPEHAGRTALRLIKQLNNQKARLIVVLVAIVGYSFFTVYTTYYSAGVIDDLLTAVNAAISAGEPFSIVWEPLGRLLTVLAVSYLLIAVFNWFCVMLMASVAETLILTLRRQIAAKMQKLPLSFFDANKPGEILSRVTNDLDRVSETLQTGLLKLLTSIGSVLGSLAFMFYYSWSLTLIFAAFILVIFAITKIVAKKNLTYSSQRQDAMAQLTGIAEEYYTGRDVIRAYNREIESEKKVYAAVQEVSDKSQKTDFLTSSVTPFIHLISRLSQFVILLIACGWMLEGKMTFGVVHAYFQYINTCTEPLAQASYMINSLQSALASAERTFEFLDGKEEVPDTLSPVQAEETKGEVVFQHVNFGYTPDKILMKDVSFTAKPGQKIAIVGSTGAGKTTLINLLMRFYELNGGKITVDGIPTTAVTRNDLRRRFGMVLQDTWLFHGTIAENIAYGKPGATREEIVRAAQMARVDYFIRTMPQGYDTVLDNDAETISIGQRQLLTIARVFLCNPPMLILDEATSSVDTKTEAEIGLAMQELMNGRTSFVIAHRLSTIRDADNILFMENGNIIEQGNHEELLKKGDAYATLYNSQFA